MATPDGIVVRYLEIEYGDAQAKSSFAASIGWWRVIRSFARPGPCPG
jgi:hypothetical protein